MRKDVVHGLIVADLCLDYLEDVKGRWVVDVSGLCWRFYRKFPSSFLTVIARAITCS